jgi:hypothetical protein
MARPTRRLAALEAAGEKNPFFGRNPLKSPDSEMKAILLSFLCIRLRLFA